MLFEASSPYRKPGICPRHPLHSQPCPFCARDEERSKREFKKAIEELMKLRLDTNDLSVKNPEVQRLPPD